MAANKIARLLPGWKVSTCAKVDKSITVHGDYIEKQ
jgi:hypothetical protein